MKEAKKVEVAVGDKIITIETGVLAQQAKGAVTVRLADTVVFSAVTAADKPKEGIDYFPLQVEYREKFYASGQFPGGFFKREARPSEKEILTARFTDRPIRPLFQQGYNNEVQINNTLLSADGENDGDILSIIAASAALVISDLPFHGPIAAARVGRVAGKFVINPTNAERAQSDLDLIYVCNSELPVMIEGDAQEIQEADLLAAMKAAQTECSKLIEAQIELRRSLGLSDKVVTDVPTDAAMLKEAESLIGAGLSEALCMPHKTERKAAMHKLRDDLKTKFAESFPEITEAQLRGIFDEIEIKCVETNVLDHKRRIDGRGFDELRDLDGAVGLIPRAHGSALFSRGETQALAVVTLGGKSDSQDMDSITGGATEKSFMFHYNFPPYCVGEVGRLGGVGRREIGHGALAERCLEQVMPKDYPYTVRLVSEIMGSNGSSSMASVCAGTLALMDAGVPILKPVAGISIGLFGDNKRCELVTDILGEEDHCGGMDFKIAGTRDGITGFQLDLKNRGLHWDIIELAFAKAKITRGQILDFMITVIAKTRNDLSQYAPRVTVVKINPEKIGELIGPGGKNIRRITDLTGAQIDIDDDGTVHVFSANKDAMELALREVGASTAEAEEGKLYSGTVTGIKEFGAFVEILPGKDGLVHISELADFRVKAVEDICKLGDQMLVKCIGVDERGRVRLSRRAAMEEKK